MTPRVVAAPLRRERESEYDEAFRQYLRVSAEDIDGLDLLDKTDAKLLDEYRVLSKAASGGGFLVPTDTADRILAAARAGSAVMQVAAEFTTATGDVLGVALDATHGSASWLAESGSYTPSDETVTQQNLGAFKATSKIRVSEELRTDEAVGLDAYLANELGARIGALVNSAATTGDGSGKPLGLVHASSPYSTVTASSGSTVKFTPTDIRAIFKGLAPAYVPMASWMLHPSDYVELAALADTPGFASLGFDPPSLLSRPVILNSDLPSPAASARSLVFGAFPLAYGVRRVQAVGVQRQEELHSDVGEVGYRAFFRVDGRPLLSAAAVIGVHSAT